MQAVWLVILPALVSVIAIVGSGELSYCQILYLDQYVFKFFPSYLKSKRICISELHGL